VLSEGALGGFSTAGEGAHAPGDGGSGGGIDVQPFQP
jgi:hypothetical protein